MHPLNKTHTDAADVKVLQRDYLALEQRARFAWLLGVLAVCQWIVLAVQISGLFGPHDWLSDAQGSRDTVRYHLCVAIQSVLVLLQVFCCTKWYQSRLRNVTLFDRLWSGQALRYSIHRNAWLFECFIILLHEPPFLVLLYDNSYKFQGLAFLRFYLFFNLFRGRSYCVTLGGRLACTIARVSNNSAFQIRYWMYRKPTLLMMCCTTGGWMLLSVAMYVGEEGEVGFSDAMWLTYITMTTVGYGDLSPLTSMGRFVACIAALWGLTSTAMLISVVSSSFSLTESQRKVADFINEAKASSEIESCAAKIVTSALKIAILKKKYGKDSSRAAALTTKTKFLCHSYRKMRRAFARFQLSMHNPNEAFNVYSRLNLLEERLMHAIHDGHHDAREEHPHGSSSPAFHSPESVDLIIGRGFSDCVGEGARSAASYPTHSHVAQSTASLSKGSPLGANLPYGKEKEKEKEKDKGERRFGESIVLSASLDVLPPMHGARHNKRRRVDLKLDSRNAVHSVLRLILNRLDAIALEQKTMAERQTRMELLLGGKGGGEGEGGDVNEMEADMLDATHPCE